MDCETSDKTTLKASVKFKTESDHFKYDDNVNKSQDFFVKRIPIEKGHEACGYEYYKIDFSESDAHNIKTQNSYDFLKRDSPCNEEFESKKHLCLCHTMSRCPLSATLHENTCDYCNNSFLTRYYPSDNGWWKLRKAVIDIRSLLANN